MCQCLPRSDQTGKRDSVCAAYTPHAHPAWCVSADLRQEARMVHTCMHHAGCACGCMPHIHCPASPAVSPSGSCIYKVQGRIASNAFALECIKLGSMGVGSVAGLCQHNTKPRPACVSGAPPAAGGRRPSRSCVLRRWRNPRVLPPVPRDIGRPAEVGSQVVVHTAFWLLPLPPPVPCATTPTPAQYTHARLHRPRPRPPNEACACRWALAADSRCQCTAGQAHLGCCSSPRIPHTGAAFPTCGSMQAHPAPRAPWQCS